MNNVRSAAAEAEMLRHLDLDQLRTQLGGPIDTVTELREAFYRHYRSYALRRDPESTRARTPRPPAPPGQHPTYAHGSVGITDILEQYPPRAGRPANYKPERGLVLIVTSFMGVEMLLPDYMGEILKLVRADKGRFFFHAAWVWEESIHSLALEEWLRAATGFTLTQGLAFYENTIRVPWNPSAQDPDFHNPLYGLAYVILQELITSYSYGNLQAYAERCDEPALARLCYRLKQEEARHFGFYRELGTLAMRHDPLGFASALYGAYNKFQMPGAYAQVPEYERGTIIAMREGVVPIPRLPELLTQSQPSSIVNRCDEGLARQKACYERASNGTKEVFRKYHLPVPINDLSLAPPR